MTTRKPDAPMHEPTTDPGIAPSERAPVDQGSVDTPRVNPPTEAELVAVPYEPATNNEDFNRLLNMLSPPATAPPIQSPTTDGELAAQYDASNLRPPRRNPTPVPEPPVLLNCTQDLRTQDLRTQDLSTQDLSTQDLPSRGERTAPLPNKAKTPSPELPEVTQPMQPIPPRAASSWPAQPVSPPSKDGASERPSDGGNAERTPRTVTIVKSSMLLPGALIGAAAAALLLFLFVCIGIAINSRRHDATGVTATISSAPVVTGNAPPLTYPPVPDDIGMPSAPATGTGTPAAPAAGTIGAGRPSTPSIKSSAPAGRPEIESAPPSKKIERKL